jgi:tRNA(Ile)-lysidine synthase
MTEATILQRVQRVVDEGLPIGERALLAVSGGLDSMVMLDAASRVRKPSEVLVATFDHASGAHSTRAVELVESTALSAGLSIVVGQLDYELRPTEAAWRDARLRFLDAAAMEHQATICTAHTRDDQAETVLFRELRAAGPRGLAGLAASGRIRRPLLSLSRAELADYAAASGVEWLDDPTNLDLRYARNRIRHELLPALRNVAPAIDSDLVAIGDRAAAWRRELDAIIDARIRFAGDRESGNLDVPAESLAGLSTDALAIIWPALLARVGLAADWRGTRRLVAFTSGGSTGQCIQLSGGWTVHRRRRGYEVRRAAEPSE